MEKLKILDFSSILCVGFSQANSQKLKEHLSLYFKDFDITFLQKPDINFYTSPIEPNLVIIDYTIGSKKIEVFIKDTLRKYGILSEDLNILYLLEQIPKKLDSTIASLLDKKKKNYIEFPKDRPSYRDLCTKAKSLIS